MKQEKVDSDKHYDPDFYKFASFEIIEDYYPLIGQLATEFNSIDDALSESLSELINYNENEIGWLLISSMGFVQKVDCWEKILYWYIHDSYLTNEKKEQEKDKVKKLAEKLKDVGAKRNKLVHADWDGMNDKLLVKNKTTTSNKGVEHHYLSIDKVEFEKIIEDFYSVYNEFHIHDGEIVKLVVSIRYKKV
ncbi:MAG: hypothetical protein ABIP51_22180 [Bacteroidia bacterium]